jgi:hypothetical protein
MTAQENYDKLKDFLRLFPRNIESKKDLFKAKDKTLVFKFELYKKYFRIDGRKRPDNVIKELKKFKKDNIFFKSEELGVKLYKDSNFNSADRYTSSSKLGAIFTKALLGTGVKLTSYNIEYRTFPTGYKQESTRKALDFKTDVLNLDFMENLPVNFRINIRHADSETGKIYDSNYNKNGLDFIHDYHNQSNDFANNLNKAVVNQDMFIYKA